MTASSDLRVIIVGELNSQASDPVAFVGVSQAMRLHDTMAQLYGKLVTEAVASLFPSTTEPQKYLLLTPVCTPIWHA